MRNKLLACGLESYDETPVGDIDTITVDVASTPEAPLPSTVDLSDEQARIQAIADDLDGLSSGLGFETARIALESLYGMEDATVTSALKRFIQMVADYIKRLYTFVREYWRKLVNANRYNVREATARASRASRELRNVRMRKFAVEGNAVALLMVGDRMPVSSIDCTRTFVDFQKNVMLPLSNWLRRSEEVVVNLETLFKRLFAEKNILDVDATDVDQLGQVTCARLPSKWKKSAVPDGHGGQTVICLSPNICYGGGRFGLSGDESTPVIRLMNAVQLAPFINDRDAVQQANSATGSITPAPEQATLTGDVVMELAKMGAAFADAQVETVGLYERIIAVTDIANKGYTTAYTFIKTDDKDAATRGSQANATINSIMAYLAYLLDVICSYNSYLTDTRNAIAVIVDGVLDAKTD